jgi:hypothetical protein
VLEALRQRVRHGLTSALSNTRLKAQGFSKVLNVAAISNRAFTGSARTRLEIAATAVILATLEKP